MGEINLKLYKPDDVWSEITKNRNGRLSPEGTLSVIFHRLIGIEDKNNDSEYVENIYKGMDLLEENNINHIFIDKGLDMAVDNKLVNDMNVFWITVTKLKNPTSKQIIDLTYRYHQDPIINKDVDMKVREALIKVLDLFRESQNNLNIVKNFYVKFINWIEIYIPKLLKNGVPYTTGESVSVIYWGDIKRDEGYFLILLSFLGVDILYLNSDSNSGFDSIKFIDKYSTKDKLAERKVYEKFPRRPKVTRTRTVARKASEELNEILHADDTGLYKPWQFEDYGVRVVPLQTTYEEMILLWKEPANFRTGFHIKDGDVHVPSIFAKISGVHEHVESYWVDFEELRDFENTVFIEKLPFTQDVVYHKQNILLKNGRFEESDVKKLSEYRYLHLRASIQKLIIDRINDVIDLEDFFVFKTDNIDFKYKVLHTILKLDQKFVDQLQKFDYVHQIPKLVIYDNDESVCSESDAIVLAFLHLIGFDIVIFTPTGYQNMEHLINKINFDNHKKPRFEMNLELPNITFGTGGVTDNSNSNNVKSKKRSWLDRLFNN